MLSTTARLQMKVYCDAKDWLLDCLFSKNVPLRLNVEKLDQQGKILMKTYVQNFKNMVFQVGICIKKRLANDKDRNRQKRRYWGRGEHK